VLKLAGSPEGWRIRVGDYRILYQIDDEAQTVTVARFQHRRNVYP
jgi:mRNA interferase RelE/StbE